MIVSYIFIYLKRVYNGEHCETLDTLFINFIMCNLKEYF
nr:MAG TPA: hypothetical protein [Caudoviricetes sp.]